jgi:putative flippase GtrA
MKGINKVELNSPSKLKGYFICAHVAILISYILHRIYTWQDFPTNNLVSLVQPHGN